MQCSQCQHANRSTATFCEACGATLAAADAAQSTQAEAEGRFYAALIAVTATLQRDRRLTYRELKHVFALDDKALQDIRRTLYFKRLAMDEDGEGLVWTGEGQMTVAPAEPMPASAPMPRAPEAERRQLTVMFCDLVGSTDLSGQLDPEDLRDVVRTYQATAAEVIERYEGHVAQYLGDGLLVYFGYPVAHEDDAQRAIHTALGIVEAMRKLNTRLKTDYGVQLAVRIGIHTGPVVVGEMGGGGRRENLALGETPNIAARLESLAPPNTTVISPVTAQLAQRAFILEELGLYELKGVAEPMMLYQVMAPQTAGPTDSATTRGFDALVGRDEEVGLLLRRWEQSKDGLGQAVLISGEAGIGKSSLVDRLRAQARQEGHACLAFRCSPYHTNSALYPVITYLEQSLGFEPNDSPNAKLDKLEQLVRTTSFPLEESLPLLASLLSVPLVDDRYPPVKMSPQRQRQQTLDMLVGWLIESSATQPALAVWEDAHWADPSTLELLGLLLDQTPTASILHVLTFRSEFAPPWPSRSHMTPMALNRLERPQVEVLIARLAGGKALPADVLEHLVTKTDGVPLYVEELTKMLLASDLIQEERGQYVLTGPLAAVAIPDTLQDSLMARLDQMQTAKEVAQLGAVLGREFTYEILQGITPQDEASLQAHLSRLVEAELLYQRGRPPQATYIFKHALIQDAAYASLLRSTRQRVHEEIAHLLEKRFPEMVETQPELVAHHCTEAGRHERAIDFWRQAGQMASQRSALAEAIAHFHQGLSCLTALPETTEHLTQELALQMALGLALRSHKGHAQPEVERAYARARALCEQLGDTTQLFPVLRGLIVYALNRGDLQKAHERGSQLLRLSESHPAPEHRMLACYQMGQILLFKGEPADACAYYREVLSIYNPQAHRDLVLSYGNDLGVGANSFLAQGLWPLGYPDQALQHGREALKLAQEVSQPYSLVFARLWLAFTHQRRRDVQDTHEQAEAAISLATEQGFEHWLALGMVLHGWAQAMQGQSDAGIAEMRRGIAAQQATGTKTHHVYFLGLLADRCGDVGCPQEGLNLLAEARDVMEAAEAYGDKSETLRLNGQLLLQQSPDNAAEAEACFRQAIAIARSQQAKSLELRAAASLARLWQSQGKRQEAYDLLAPIYSWFTEGFETADLQDAKVLLDNGQ